MLRARHGGRLLARFVLAFTAGACPLAAVRAEAPVNPLRQVSAKTPATPNEPTPAAPFRPSSGPLWDEPVPRPLARSLIAAEAETSDPPSVVPPALGQPELLPAPAGLGALSPNPAQFDWSDADASRHLVHPWFDEPWFAHSDPNDPHRHIGLGQPLIGTSWRNRPWYFGTFVGGVLMDDLISNRVYQNDTPLVGLRLGYDFDHFWGLESRWAFANPELTNGAGTPLADPSRDYFADVSLAYYPFGDARWRPYLSAGLGFQTFRFNDDQGQRISESMLSVPLGVGVKYFYGPWFSLRFDLYDNLGIGNARVSGMHNFSLMAGVEFRFGGRRQSYFPWHNNTSYW
jgi:Outer membrane protein beta-barrel domain